MNRQRQLTYRFVELPYIHRRDIIQSLMPGFTGANLEKFFTFCKDNDLLAKLWEEIEMRHEDGKPNENPFKKPIPQLVEQPRLPELGFRLSYDDLSDVVDMIYTKFMFGIGNEQDRQVAEMRRRCASAAVNNVISLAGWTPDEYEKEVASRIADNNIGG